MSTYHYAHLAYGFHLGDANKYEIEEVDQYGSMNMPWVKRDSDGYVDEALDEALVRKLYEAIPDADPERTEIYEQDDIVKSHYGVEILEHGWKAEGDTPSYALIAHEIRVDGGDATQISLFGLMKMQVEQGFDEKLDRVLKILEITPNQYLPSWLLMASR